ncbi:MAG: phasin [Rhizobiaceae bacterium]|nr:phasin [Rhizobiaceae bacterium]
MSKTATKTAETLDTIEFPAFDANKATDQIRTFAEKSLAQSKDAYAKMKAGAEETQKAIESTFESAKNAGNDVSMKAIAALRANAELSLSHLEKLVGVKSAAEFFELQTAFIRKGVEQSVEHAKELQSVTSKAAENVAKPMKDVFEKAVKELKVA